jgi:hypothetical protein
MTAGDEPAGRTSLSDEVGRGIAYAARRRLIAPRPPAGVIGVKLKRYGFAAPSRCAYVPARGWA